MTYEDLLPGDMLLFPYGTRMNIAFFVINTCVSSGMKFKLRLAVSKLWDEAHAGDVIANLYRNKDERVLAVVIRNGQEISSHVSTCK